MSVPSGGQEPGGWGVRGEKTGSGEEFRGEESGSEPLRLVIFGDSITAGYGVGPEEAFPARLQAIADSLQWDLLVVNAGLSGETSAGGLRRVDWVLRQRTDLFVLELGGNDGLRGLDPEATKQNLQGILDRVSARYPDAILVLAGMEAPPNMGESYTRRFREIYRELAEENDLLLIPFILEGVAGIRDLNQPDGIHPTPEGHRRIARHLWSFLRPELEKISKISGSGR